MSHLATYNLTPLVRDPFATISETDTDRTALVFSNDQSTSSQIAQLVCYEKQETRDHDLKCSEFQYNHQLAPCNVLLRARSRYFPTCSLCYCRRRLGLETCGRSVFKDNCFVMLLHGWQSLYFNGLSCITNANLEMERSLLEQQLFIVPDKSFIFLNQLN